MNSLLTTWPGTTALIGLVLLHFLWQGALIAAGLAVALRFTRHQPAALRHHLACGALLLLLLAPLLTLFTLGEPAGEFAGLGGVRTTTSGVTTDAPSLPGDSAPFPIQGLALLTWGWAVGVSILAVRLAGGWWQVIRLAFRGTTPAPVEWQERLRQLQDRLSVRRAVRLAESLRVSAPVLMGWIRPVILLPVGMLTRLPTAQVEAILLHELAHIRGHDFLINLLQRVAETLLFYHPAVWWVSEQIRREREHRCDDCVVAVQGHGRTLADALLSLAEQSADVPSLAVAADGGSVADRVQRLLGAPVVGSPALGKGIRWGLLVVVLVGLGFWLVPRWTAPQLYQSTARLFIKEPLQESDPRTSEPFATPNRTLLQRAVARVGAEEILGARWGMSREEVRTRLQQQPLQVKIQRSQANPSIVEITVASEDPLVAANLATAIAHDVCESSKQQRRAEKNGEAYRAEQKKLMLDTMLKSALERRNSLWGDPSSGEYAELDAQVKMLTELKLQKSRELIMLQLEALDSHSAGIVIIEEAVPALRPIRWLPQHKIRLEVQS